MCNSSVILQEPSKNFIEFVDPAEESLDQILNSVSNSIEDVVRDLKSLNKNFLKKKKKIPKSIKKLLKEKGDFEVEDVSLLNLKNSLLSSYLNNLVLIILGRLETVLTKREKKREKINELRAKSVKGCIVLRCGLEKGVKTLEKNLEYQFNKMVRVYNRFSVEKNTDLKEQADELDFKPNIESLEQTNKTKGSEFSENEESESYVPPRITPAHPPTQDAYEQKKINSKKRQQRLRSMEEYIEENHDAPVFEPSIGKDIDQKGFQIGDDYTKRKVKEIEEYEENNYTRLPGSVTKKVLKKKRNNQDYFGGEDWLMFNLTHSDRPEKEFIKRRRTTAWDRLKKKN